MECHFLLLWHLANRYLCSSYQWLFPSWPSLAILSKNKWALLMKWLFCCFTKVIILSLSFKSWWWTHQVKAGSCCMPLAMTYLGTCIGCDSLRLDKFSHDGEQSFYLQKTFQPAVIFLRSLSLYYKFLLQWVLNHHFYDQEITLTIYTHYHWHHRFSNHGSCSFCYINLRELHFIKMWINDRVLIESHQSQPTVYLMNEIYNTAVEKKL